MEVLGALGAPGVVLGGSGAHLGSKTKKSEKPVVRWTPSGLPNWSQNFSKIVMLASLEAILSIKVPLWDVFLVVLALGLIFEAPKPQNSRFLRGATFNNSTTLQWFSHFFTFSKNRSPEPFCLHFGSHFGSILGALKASGASWHPF